MLNNLHMAVARSGAPSFTTIDDCLHQARQLLSTLGSLAHQKHPLAVRKGSALPTIRKGVERMTETQDGKVVKAGGKTYFFDLKQTKEGKPYLVITESHFQGEGKARTRVSLAVFPEHAQAFAQTVTEMTARLG